MKDTPTPFAPARNKKSLIIKLSLALIVVAALLGTGFGVYTWQQQEAKKEQKSLQAKIDDLKKADAPVTPEETPDTPTPSSPAPTGSSYTTRVGGLSIKLADPYVIIVNADGNSGGAPGATLKIGKKQADGVVSDHVYEWLEIDIDLTGSITAEQAATILRDELAKLEFRELQITDTSFGELPAKLVTGKGIGYEGQRRAYIVKSGDYVYKFDARSQDSSQDTAALKAAIEGSTITPKFFQ